MITTCTKGDDPKTIRKIWTILEPQALYRCPECGREYELVPRSRRRRRQPERTTTLMTIHRLSITNYLGIKARELDLPNAGAVIAGANGEGKTSILKAIRAALAAQGITPDTIRLGADKAEILVSLDDLTVRRAISRKGSTLTVTQADGARRPSPQTYLTELLGISPLDPLDLFLEQDPKRRRAKILEALPCKITPEQVARWGLPASDVSSGLFAMHGLEALDSLSQKYVDLRKVANRVAAVAADENDRARAAMIASLEISKAHRDAIPSDLAQAELEAARSAAAVLFHRQQAAETTAKASAKTRAKVSALREQASMARAAAILAPDAAAFEAARARAVLDRKVAGDFELEIDSLEKQLEDMRARRHDAIQRTVQAERLLEQLEASEANATAEQHRIADLEGQALDLEQAIATVEPVTPAELEVIAQRVRLAQEAVERAGAANAAAALAEQHGAAAQRTTERLMEAKAEAEKLDAVVKTLRTEAPTELLAGAEAIPGLTVEADAILLDGVSLERLSGAEQMRFAVDISRRLNARSKLIVVDGLERLDPEQLPRFLGMATEGGYQVIATRVAGGAAHVEPIEVQP